MSSFKIGNVNANNVVMGDNNNMTKENSNLISIITRRDICDQIMVSDIAYYGRLSELEFLGRLYDLKNLPSNDSRYDDAYGDIYQHTVNNNDWSLDWIFTDPRINLFHCDDESLLRFLAETVHPIVRNEKGEISFLLDLYYRLLKPDGFEIYQSSEISGRPVYNGRKIIIGEAHLAAKKVEIKKYLNTDYLNQKIHTMNSSVNENTDLAIGTAKELIETICKSILKQKGVTINSDWEVARLVKETNAVLDFSPKNAEKPQDAEKSIKQILGGISSSIQGITELRNAYGSGHGKDADFKGLEPKYAKLIVGLVSEFAIFFLATNGEATELVE